MTTYRDRLGNNYYRTFMVYRTTSTDPVIPVPCPFLSQSDILVETLDGVPLDVQWLSEGFIRIPGVAVGESIVVRRRTSLVPTDPFVAGDIMDQPRLNDTVLRTLYRTQEGVDISRRFDGLYPTVVLLNGVATVDETWPINPLDTQEVVVNGVVYESATEAPLNPGNNFLTTFDTTTGYPVALQIVTRVVWSINDPVVNETDGTATFTVDRQDGGRSVRISYQTTNGTALAGVDYMPVSVSNVSFGTTRDIEVAIIDRPGGQGDRTFFLEVTLEASV